ncbi:hypothetical protein HK101_000429 [Irineochytrium annulatum]|nr:hypothetical protein HK101_000429 [Irineochytrium annulatum]
MAAVCINDVALALDLDADLHPTEASDSKLPTTQVKQREAEAHRPELKGVGKSDCSVKIVSIAEAEKDVPLNILDDGTHGRSSEVLQEIFSNACSANHGHHGSFTLAGSRAVKAQKAMCRPPLARRESQRHLQGSRNFSQVMSSKQHITDSTVRRLTSGMWAVRKQAFSGGKQDGSRLLKQIRKQILFSATCRTVKMNATVTTPEIYGIRVPEQGVKEGTITVDMEYIPYQDVRHIIGEEDVTVHKWLVDAAIALVDHELTTSELVKLGTILPEFDSKAQSIKKAVLKCPLMDDQEAKAFTDELDWMMQRFNSMRDLEVPVGNCHGDLTFQNMLVDPVHRELCVFDFLDCFVESPLQDLAKLLQDCRHLWFFTQVDVPEDKRARAVATLAFFYDRIDSAYESYSFWDAVPLFEYFCLARILPYMTIEKEKKCILQGLTRIVDGLKKSDATAAGGATVPPGVLERGDSGVAVIGQQQQQAGHVVEETTTVIVPAVGPDMATVYPDGKIKLLTLNVSIVKARRRILFTVSVINVAILLQPNGRPLIVDCIHSLSCDKASRIIVAVRRSLVLDHFCSEAQFEKLFDILRPEKRSRLHFHYSTHQTHDTVETVSNVIREKNVQGPIFIKDADNDFSHPVEAGNYVTFLNVVREESNNAPVTPGEKAVASLLPERESRPDLIDATRKSYVSFSYDNIVSNIAMKSFISSQFCCGGWSFLEASHFVSGASKLRGLLGGVQLGGEVAQSSLVKLRVMDVMWQLMCEGHLFFGAKVTEYDDWGSVSAWTAYKDTFETHWIDLERLVSLISLPEAKTILEDLLDKRRRTVIIFYTNKPGWYLDEVRAMCDTIAGCGSQLQMVHSVVSPGIRNQ